MLLYILNLVVSYMSPTRHHPLNVTLRDPIKKLQFYRSFHGRTNYIPDTGGTSQKGLRRSKLFAERNPEAIPF